jgi:O-methyltransferase domain/Dimerisation domain
LREALRPRHDQSGAMNHATTHDAGSALIRLINGFQATQAIHVVATLRLADHLRSVPMTIKELSTATRTHSVALYRLMRALAAIGVFQEDEDGRFAMTALSELLRSDVPGTYAPMAELVGRPYYWQAWGNLLHTVCTGGVAFNHVHGTGIWDYRANRPLETRIFDQAMAAGTERSAKNIIRVCNFARFQHVVDVGGGDGMFLAKTLVAFPRIHGTLFDQPHVTAKAATTLESFGVASRCQVHGGDFFLSVPAGADAYLLKWILHDWDDKASIDILRSCHRAMKPASRLLVVEHVIGPPNAAPEGKFLDLTMMVNTGGRERTREEFAALFADAGFRMVSVTPTTGPLSLIEGALA